MRNAFFKQAAVLALAAAMVVGTTSTALAGEWKRHKYYGGMKRAMEVIRRISGSGWIKMVMAHWNVIISRKMAI